MPNKYKLEATIIDNDDDSPISIEDIKSDIIQQLTDICLEVEGEITIIEIGD